MRDNDPYRKAQLKRRFQGIHRLFTSLHTSRAACTIQSTHHAQHLTYTAPRLTPAPQPASHAVTTQTPELVTPPITQHGREVDSPPTAHITVSSDLLLKLREEIEALKSEVKELREEVTRLKAAPPPVATPPPRSQYKIWHQESNRITGAFDSRSPPTHSYDCALHGSDRCGWCNKRVTLQAYVLHLKRKHRLNISDNPEMRLLPVLSNT